jgi:tetratricopeptide (TPR) repeat protein
MTEKISDLNTTAGSESPDLPEDTLLSEENAAADGGSDSANLASRFQIRTAINSIYSPRREKEEPPVSSEDWSKLAEQLPKAQAVEFVKQAKALAKEGDKDKALQLLAQAVRLDKDNLDAWTWMGGLLLSLGQNLERAKFCLNRALEISPDNERAKRGLAQIEELLNPPVTALATIEEEASELVEEPKPSLKIGLEEAVAELRKSGLEVDPERVPHGGAKLRELAQREGLKFRRRRQPVNLPFLPKKSLKLSMIVLLGMILLTAVGFAFILVKRAEVEASLTPQPSPIATLPPTPTLTTDETFAFRMRGTVDGYFSFFANVKEMRQQFDSGKIRWDDLKRGYKDLQGQSRELKKQVDAMANRATAKLLPAYKKLQEIGLVAITGADFMVSGVDHVSDEDLNEGTRQFNRANSLLLDLARLIESLAPLPTVTPAPTVTPTFDPTAAPTPTPTSTPELTVTTTPVSVTPAPTTSILPDATTPPN